jgi:hypothetical protein
MRSPSSTHCLVYSEALLLGSQRISSLRSHGTVFFSLIQLLLLFKQRIHTTESI